MGGVQYVQKVEGAQRTDKPGAIPGVISEAEITKIIKTDRVAQEMFYKVGVTNQIKDTPNGKEVAVYKTYVPLGIKL